MGNIFHEILMKFEDVMYEWVDHYDLTGESAVH